MRIYIMVADDPVFKPPVLCRLLLRRGREVCGVAEVGNLGTGSGRLAGMIAHYRFLGARCFLFMGFYKRFLKVLSRLPLPSFITSRLSIAGACARFRVPCEYVHDVNAPGFMGRLSALSPDVIVSCQGQIFSPELLSIARIACINCHPSKLPKYRGRWPVFAAMLNGDETIGVTAHTMTARIDKGTILCQREFTTSREKSFMDNYALAHELYADVILEALELIESTDISGYPQVPADAPYYKTPSPEEIRRFRSSGLRMI
jgi:hypothetical protein